MFAPLRLFLNRVITTGHVHVTTSDGETSTFGNITPPHVTLNIKDRATERALAFNPGLALGEAYMEGRIEITEGSIYDLIALALEGNKKAPLPGITPNLNLFQYLTRTFRQLNTINRARLNTTRHYDIDETIYDLFLDPDRQYSCAYFDATDDLDRAQLLKKRHVCAKLAIAPHHHVLDIGSGWGGLALYIAKLTGAHTTGITLSDNQLATSRRRATRLGLSHSVRFELKDYRQLDRPFDRIVSVGMLEHVGTRYYPTYFNAIAKLLKDDGVAIVHSIGRTDGPGITNAFIAKHIFPGGYFPALSEVLPIVEQAGLIVSDIEILRLHYAKTLRAWRTRFTANRATVIAHLGPEFYRMWEFYLAGSEAAFRHDNLIVFQIQLIKNLDALPITRDYIAEEERRLARLEQAPDHRLPLAGE